MPNPHQFKQLQIKQQYQSNELLTQNIRMKERKLWVELWLHNYQNLQADMIMKFRHIRTHMRRSRLNYQKQTNYFHKLNKQHQLQLPQLRILHNLHQNQDNLKLQWMHFQHKHRSQHQKKQQLLKRSHQQQYFKQLQLQQLWHTES